MSHKWVIAIQKQNMLSMLEIWDYLRKRRHIIFSQFLLYYYLILCYFIFDLALPLVEDAIKIDKVKEEQCQISVTESMNQTASTKIKRYRNAIVNEIEMPDDMKNMVIDVAVKAFKK